MCREWLIREIQICAKENNGLAKSCNVNSRVRQMAAKEFGSWRDACLEAGVDCPSLIRKRVVKAKEMNEILVKQPSFDFSKGIEEEGECGSICFDCARSGAPVRYRCSWDAELVLPKGAIYRKAKIKNARGISEDVPIIMNCPNFVNIKDESVRKAIRNERLRELEEMKKYGMVGVEAAKAGGRRRE